MKSAEHVVLFVLVGEKELLMLKSSEGELSGLEARMKVVVRSEEVMYLMESQECLLVYKEGWLVKYTMESLELSGKASKMYFMGDLAVD